MKKILALKFDVKKSAGIFFAKIFRPAKKSSILKESKTLKELKKGASADEKYGKFEKAKRKKNR